MTAPLRAEEAIRPSFRITDPLGHEIRIPATADEDFAYFTADQGAAIRQYYRDNGYVVIRNLVPSGLCGQAMERFEAEVKPSNHHIYRQTTANPERHVFTEHGYVLNPILNVQSLSARRFPRFREVSLAVITHPDVQGAVREILGEPGKLVQSMYFQGNPATWAHQDTYYLDGEKIGSMTAAWMAMEDIAPGAGRFFVYPRSHLMDLAKNGGDVDVAFNHHRYKKLVVDAIQAHGLECRAPALRRGDVLFWASKTVHGSMATTQPQFSRSSFTGHYIPDSARFLQFQTRFMKLDLERIGGMRVHKPKDMNRPLPRAVLRIETAFPRTFQTAKKIAIKALTR